jgi:hypothetical protein
MFRFALLAPFTAAEAGAAESITWSDCGAKHATVTDLQPLSFHIGATETITATGTIDEDVTLANFTATVSSLGQKLSDCHGDGTSDIVCHLPLGAGEITMKALDFPLLAGNVSIPVEIKTIPGSILQVDLHIAATDQDGEDVICLDVNTATTGKCSADEFEILADTQDIWVTVGACINNALPFFGDGIDTLNTTAFNECFTSYHPVSTACTSCYLDFGRYLYPECGIMCSLCFSYSADCLSCYLSQKDSLDMCTGFSARTPIERPCDFLA